MSGSVRRVFVLAVLLLASSESSALAQNPLTPDLTSIPAEKVAAIREHLLAARTAEIMVASVEASLESQRAMTPDVPADFWDEFAKRLSRDIGRFIEALIPLYHESYTQDELEGLTAFYLSPLGQRLIDSSLEISLETAALGEQWGAIVGAEVMLDLANRGRAIPTPNPN